MLALSPRGSVQIGILPCATSYGRVLLRRPRPWYALTSKARVVLPAVSLCYVSVRRSSETAYSAAGPHVGHPNERTSFFARRCL